MQARTKRCSTMAGKYEVERRFLVRAEKGLLATFDECRRLKQGYLLTGERSLRIRVGENRGAVLTAKVGTGVRRLETEVVVPNEIAEALFLKADQQVIEKVRWYIGPWELDQFLGSLSGLFLLEVELERADDELPDRLPSGVRVIREVTDDNRWTSSGLAVLTELEQRTLVEMAYSERSS